MNAFIKYVGFTLVFSHTLYATASQDSKERAEIGKQLSDCGALFGLISQANTKQTEVLRSFSTASIMYAQTAFNDDAKFQKETGKSMQKAAAFVTELQKTNDKNRFEEEFKTCMSTLEIAENTLRSEMPEISKEIVPELFK